MQEIEVQQNNNVEVEEQEQEEQQQLTIDKTDYVQQDQLKEINEEIQSHQQNEIQDIDFWDMIIKGDFDFFYLYPNKIDCSFLGPQGFGIVHYLATYNQINGLQILKKMGADLDQLSSGNQTALAIACNYGFIEIAKYLIDQGCKIDYYNKHGWNPLYYAIKNKHYPLIFYLLVKLQNLPNSDEQGASVHHVSASANDVNMLRFYNVFQTEYNLFDKQGQTPLTRAIKDISIQYVKELLYEQPNIVNYAIELKVVNSSRILIKSILEAQFRLRLNGNLKLMQLKQFFVKFKKFIITTLLAIVILIELILFLFSDVQQSLNDDIGGLIFDILYILGLLYSIFFIIWFIYKTTDNQKQGTKILESKINKLKEQNQQLEQQNNNTDIHMNINQHEGKVKEKKQKKERKLQKVTNNNDFELIPINVEEQKLVENEINENQQAESDIESDDEEDERDKFIKKIKQQQNNRTSLYLFQLTPPFLEGIKLKDFLYLNYKPVEDLIDKMQQKPHYYFKFANRLSEYKEEINALLEINDPLWYNGFTIIHLLYFLFETNRFRLIHRITWERICFTCLSYKLPRTFHCRSCNQCVRDYHFHSNFLGKCINSTNHFFYFIVLITFTILINIDLLLIFMHYYDQIKSIFVVIPNIYFLIQQNSNIQAIRFIINLSLGFILNIQSMIEIVCIIYNMTYYELFNSNRCKYLYQPITSKNGKVYLTYRKRLEGGLMFNAFSFLKNSFRNLKLL